MSDAQLKRIESLWRIYQQRRIATPDLSVNGFAAAYPDVKSKIIQLFPMLNELKQFAADPIPCPEQIGEYNVMRQIGIGGMGIVYEAENHSLQDRVAIKIVEPSLINGRNVRQLEKEARLAATLHHSNIVPVFEFGEFEENYFYTMKYIDGPNLSEILHLDRSELCDELSTAEQRIVAHADKLSCNWVYQIDLMLQIADAIAYAHEKGVLHRDVKPANLLLDDDFKIWITDFGLAKLRADDQRLSVKSKVMGTPRYMAPEQIRGEADERSDVFGLGLCFYEMSLLRSDAESGRRPIWKGGLQPPSHFNVLVPRPIEKLIMKAVSLDPNQRHQCLDELIEELNSVRRELVSDTRIAVEKPVSKIPVAFAFLIVIAGLAIGSMLFQYDWFSFRNNPSESTNSIVSESTEPLVTEKVLSLVEGESFVAKLNPDLVGFEALEFEISGPDARHFVADDEKNLMVTNALDFDVARDQNLDNAYELELQNQSGDKICKLSIRVLDKNEAPKFNERIFTGGDDTVAIHHSKSQYPTRLDFRDDGSRLHDGLVVSLSGGADRDQLIATPGGAIAFSRAIDFENPLDIDGDNIYEVELKVQDRSFANYATLKRNDDGFQLLIHQLDSNSKLKTLTQNIELPISADVIDISTSDGEEFLHIHDDGAGTAALYRTMLNRSSGQTHVQLLSDDCGIPVNALGFCRLGGNEFLFLKFDAEKRVVLCRATLGARDTFNISNVEKKIDISANIAGFSCLDKGRYQFIKDQVGGKGRFYFAFAAGKRFALMPLSRRSEFDYQTQGMAAWIEQDSQSLTTVRTIKFEIVD